MDARATPFWVLEEDDGRAGLILHGVAPRDASGWTFTLRLQDGEQVDATLDAPLARLA